VATVAVDGARLRIYTKHKGDVLDVGIAAIEYILGSDTVSLEKLETQGLLESPAARLREFGFACVHVSGQPSYILAAATARKLMETSRIDPGSVDAIFYAGATPSSHAVETLDPLSAFSYPVAQLQYELELTQARAFGISQIGCLGMVSSVALARDFLRANDGASRALCVSADVLPRGCKREMIYNVISDGACAVLVEKGCKRTRILAYRQITKGYYWDPVRRKNEIAAAYFPTARNIVRDTLADANMESSNISCILPHNVSVRSWEILLGLLQIGREKLFSENIGKFAHVIAADNWINLKDAMETGRLHPGDKLLLFTFGFGANWACMVLEH
jgi:3-oxoacyl-[acyl-carrier-protein] synthase-3